MLNLTVPQRRWRALFPTPDVAKCDTVFADLMKRYAEPWRQYHNLEHLLMVLDWISTLRSVAPLTVHLAGWFHDAVYDPKRSDNEEQSAELARKSLAELGMEAPSLAEVGRLILLTKTHQTVVEDDSGAVLLDADLTILSFPWASYCEYARGIRAEYSFVSDEAYRAGRKEVLSRFLSRPWIYATQSMREGGEESARANLQRELESFEETVGLHKLG